MIDKILPCPECGDYPDFNLNDPSINRYTISINCCCKETCKVINRLEDEQNDLISIIGEWNDFAEANQTVKVLKSDLKYVQDGLEYMKNRFEEIFTDDSRHELVTRISVKLKKYLSKE